MSKENLLNEDFVYHPKSGALWERKECKGVCRLVNRTNLYGYVLARHQNKNVLAHRLIWALYYGEWPKGSIDHINGVRHDNRIVNLRVVCSWENSHNNKVRRKDGGLVGTYWHHDNKWESVTTLNGKRFFLGFFPTEEEAYKKYVEFNESLGRSL